MDREKDMIIKRCMWTLTPQVGEVFFDGEDIKKNSKVFKKYWVRPQKIYLSDDTIKNNCYLGQDEKDFILENYKNAITSSKLDEVWWKI